MTSGQHYDRFRGVTEGLAIKRPVLAATTAAVTLSGEQTVDGVALEEGDRVLVKDQSDGRQNGIYSVSTSAWQRTLDFDGNRDIVKGTQVYVVGGTVNGNKNFAVATADPITLGTSNISFSALSSRVALTSQSITHSASGALAINAALGNVVRLTQSANITEITLTNFGSSGPDWLQLWRESTGTYTIDFSGFYGQNGIQPYVTDGVALDIFTIVTRGDGRNMIAVGGLNFQEL